PMGERSAGLANFRICSPPTVDGCSKTSLANSRSTAPGETFPSVIGSSLPALRPRARRMGVACGRSFSNSLKVNCSRRDDIQNHGVQNHEYQDPNFVDD